MIGILISKMRYRNFIK